ncbi:diguanylate cyclase [Domibacillus sp. PGB-M46]|uniref:diguanylate cyclase n=1 Tax=Domibacillus sp. PGB-M46 TaxID=2910255 RepID=UPI002107A59A|nr:diguanylate cyclase [Domibacillus sp. PGB-M46]
MVARVGGREFMLTLINTSLEDGIIIIKRIRKQVESPSLVSIPMTLTVGLEEYKQESIEHVLEKADKALYQAKETGRNRWFVS